MFHIVITVLFIPLNEVQTPDQRSPQLAGTFYHKRARHVTCAKSFSLIQDKQQTQLL